MAGHLATNQGGSFVWQMGGVALSIILLAHLKFGKLLHTSIDDTHYRAMGGDSDHRPLCLQLNIDCSFVELQHMVVTKKLFLPRFNYDKSKVEEYQLALTTSLGNLWVANLIGHLGADELANLLQQCMGAATKSIFGNKLSGGSCRKRHCHKP